MPARRRRRCVDPRPHRLHRLQQMGRERERQPERQRCARPPPRRPLRPGGGRGGGGGGVCGRLTGAGRARARARGWRAINPSPSRAPPHSVRRLGGASSGARAARGTATATAATVPAAAVPSGRAPAAGAAASRPTCRTSWCGRGRPSAAGGRLLLQRERQCGGQVRVVRLLHGCAATTTTGGGGRGSSGRRGGSRGRGRPAAGAHHALQLRAGGVSTGERVG